MIATFIFLISLSLLSTSFAANEVQRARCYIYEAVKGGVGSKLMGIVDFEQSGSYVKLNGSLSGLAPGLHGFHVHEKGDLGNGCLSAGGHFNPHKMDHGSPSDSNRHVGDLGNLKTPESGDTIVSVSDSLASLNGQHSVLGRALVVHEKVDDLGKGGAADSLKTGNAGGRLGCGVIGILEEEDVTSIIPPLSSINHPFIPFFSIILPLFFLY